jgi:hypothetical protein
MARMVSRLTDLDIDEVSVVPRPANQHGLIVIAKSNSEEGSNMGVYDADGDEVFEEELQVGDHVFSEDGQEWYVPEDGEGAEEGAGDRELQAVGKAIPGEKLVNNVRNAASKVGWKHTGEGYAGAAKKKVDPHRGKIGLATGAVGGYGAAQVGKSAGSIVLDELSKALNDSDRDAVFAKAVDRFDEIDRRNDELEQLVVGLYNDRDAEGFSDLAKGYDIPGDTDEIGAILHRASQVLPQEDLATLDRLFSSVGKADFEQIGYDGAGESDTLSQVFAMAGEVVSKSDSAMSQEQAVVALIEANPDAYDAYENEQRRF